MSKADFRVLAARCHTSSCCPTIMESPDGEEIVVVGGIGGALLSTETVKTRIGDQEAAVVIPKSVFLQACAAILRGNLATSSMHKTDFESQSRPDGPAEQGFGGR